MRNDIIIKTVCFYYPDVSAIYLFGSYSTEYERMDSDVDIAPPPSCFNGKGGRTAILERVLVCIGVSDGTSRGFDQSPLGKHRVST